MTSRKTIPALLCIFIPLVAFGQAASRGSSGITKLTGDVTAGPGSGSVSATLANIPASVTASGTSGTTVTSAVANTGSNLAFSFDTTNSLSGSTQIAAFSTGGVKRFTLVSDGTVAIDNTIFAPTVSYGNRNSLSSTVSGSLRLLGTQVDGAGNIGVRVDNNVSFSTVGALLLDVQNNTVHKFSVDKDGNIASASHINCTMSAGTTCTATVPSGSICLCGSRTGSASAVSCNVSSTTATCTASASNSTTWNILVW